MQTRSALLALSCLLLAATASAQQRADSAATPAAPAVGAMAPDVEFLGATRYGMLGERSRLSDFRGQTVVLWLFIKARTRG